MYKNTDDITGSVTGRSKKILMVLLLLSSISLTQSPTWAQDASPLRSLDHT